MPNRNVDSKILQIAAQTRAIKSEQSPRDSRWTLRPASRNRDVGCDVSDDVGLACFGEEICVSWGLHFAACPQCSMASCFSLTRSNRCLSHERSQSSRVVVFDWCYAECDRDVLDGLDVVFGADLDGEGLAGDDGSWGVEACDAGGCRRD